MEPLAHSSRITRLFAGLTAVNMNTQFGLPDVKRQWSSVATRWIHGTCVGDGDRLPHQNELLELTSHIIRRAFLRHFCGCAAVGDLGAGDEEAWPGQSCRLLHQPPTFIHTYALNFRHLANGL
jgi:hypothetical protein